MMKLQRFAVFYLVMMLFALSCANRIPLDGGLKDSTPPKIVKSNPDSAQLNFNGTLLFFTFDEYVELKDGGTSIAFSPPLKKNPTYILRKKTLEVKLQEPLEENTTYNVSFGKSITDLNEGNVFKDQSWVFSTGPVLDSLSLSGKVVEMISGKPAANVKAMLYTALNDSTPYKTSPRYFALSNESGRFTINNIKQGRYFIFVQKDENGNLLLDNPDELIAFDTLGIQIDSNITLTKSLQAFTNVPAKQKLLKKSFEIPGKLILKTALPLKNPEFKLLKPINQKIESWVAPVANDSILLFMPRFLSDSLQIEIKSDDYNDTISMNLRGTFVKSMARKGSSVVDTSFVVSNSLISNTLAEKDTLFFYFNRPLAEFNKENLQLTKDSLPVSFDLKSNSGNLTSAITFKKLPGEKFSLVILPKAFQDIYGRANDTIRVNFAVNTEKDIGSITLKLVDWPKNDNYLLQMLGSNGKVIKSESIKNQNKFSFEGMRPGTYRFRIVVDTNNDKRWTSGSFERRTPPEQVFILSEELVVRPSWDIETEWKFASDNISTLKK